VNATLKDFEKGISSQHWNVNASVSDHARCYFQGWTPHSWLYLRCDYGSFLCQDSDFHFD
jgi:hypothetical protein